MKNLHTLLGVLLIASLASCSSETLSDNDGEQDKKKQNIPSTMGKKTVAPLINMSEFAKMSKEELRLARNTVFAKYGRVFKSEDLKDHFSKQDWYNPRPTFKESDLKKQDRDLVNLIQLWENKTKVLLEERADITGNGNYEDCFVLYNKNKATYAIVVNDFSQEFDHFWGQNKDSQGVPEDWSKINAKIIDIDSEDFKQEVHVSQRYDDWEDPGTHNVIVAFKDGIKVTELSSTDYDAGTLDINGSGTVTMNFSNCPPHSKMYKLESGKLTMFDEKIGPTPPGGCAACFSGDALVAISENKTKRLEDLSRGDLVLTYFESINEFKQTKVERIIARHHEDLYSIEIGSSKLTVTEDHPFLTNKGWCSLSPEKTMNRYGYVNVGQLAQGTKLIGQHGLQEVKTIEPTSEGQMTYTIASLANGTNFLVNGVIVGVEKKVLLP